ncbi:hypothetical protein C8P69_1347 [Phreatobacter oligotrophus]|uniref:Uncharacterized protein n=1 Tax=Phreatobacter oligotrophus TaxID=1122261 RepID=A0A2T4YLS1_9HYPH|nr:hypothetical protein C8P69_1347 [Phreatobacter oligotrophus]
MLFGLEQDRGNKIVWYVVPDGYGGVARSAIFGEGQKRLVMEANEIRSALVDAGRHPTGLCGFSLDEQRIPDLNQIIDLEIRDVETDVLIYRRPKPSDISARIIQIYPELFPPRALIVQLDPLFQYSGLRLEVHGHETVTQFFHIRDCESLFFSGRFLFQNYEGWIEDRFKPIIFVNDPYVVLAERLLVLSKINQVGRPELIIGERDAMLFKPAIEFASSIDLQNAREVKAALKHVPEDVAVALADPTTRILTCSSPLEMPRTGCLAKSLDFLAGCAVVGIAEREELYADTIAELLGLRTGIIPLPSRFGGLLELAALLRSSGRAERLLARDLELYDAVKAAFEKAA